MSYEAVVIGGGINGLVAAAVLARRGKSVCLMEHSDQLGGMAAPGTDGSARLAHLLWNLSPAVRRDIGMNPHTWPFAQVKVPTVALGPDGRHVILRGTSVAYSDGTAHPDAAAHAALMKRLVSYGALLRHLAEGTPPGLDAPVLSSGSLRQLARLARLGWDLKRMEKAEFRRFLQVLLSNAYDLILDEMPDGPLAGLLAADAVRGAAAGPRSPGTVFSLVYRLGHGGEVTLPEGGMGAVVDAFADAARAAGVEIRTGTGVSRILLAEDAVTAIETTGGETVQTRLVLSNAGALNTARMAGIDAFDIEATRRSRNIRARGTAAKINLTLDAPLKVPGVPDDLGPVRYVYAPTAEYVERAFDPSKYKEMSEDPVIEALATPDGRVSIITQYAPVDLIGGWTPAAKERLRALTVATLARAIPPLPDRITSAEVITPDQIAAETGAPGGHWHHGELALDQLLTLRPVNGMGRYTMGPKGMMLCGAGSHPGGDVMGLAGRNAALKALEVWP